MGPVENWGSHWCRLPCLVNKCPVKALPLIWLTLLWIVPVTVSPLLRESFLQYSFMSSELVSLHTEIRMSNPWVRKFEVALPSLHCHCLPVKHLISSSVFHSEYHKVLCRWRQSYKPKWKSEALRWLLQIDRVEGGRRKPPPTQNQPNQTKQSQTHTKQTNKQTN